MKQLHFIILVLVVVFSGCKKDEAPPVSGTETIDNTTHMGATYYIYGFSFTQAKQVSTTETPGPDIIVYVNVDNPASPRLYLAANNLRPSFSKAGDYPNETEAKNAFQNLKSISATQWVDLADPIVPNQVWLYRSGQDTYAKFRIISTVMDKRNNPELNQLVDYGQMTFEWVHQPDGSLTFP